MEVYLHSFLTLALDGVGCFTRQFSPIRNWIGPTVGPEVLEKETFPFACWELNIGSSSLVTTLTELSWLPIGQDDKHVCFVFGSPALKICLFHFFDYHF